MIFKEKQNIISFIPQNDFVKNVMDFPQPATNFVPDWYKKIDPYKNSKYRISPSKKFNSTVKVCMPFFDTITSGYMITLPCDVLFVDRGKYEHKVYWDAKFVPIGEHSLEQIKGMPLPYNYDFIWKWIFHFIIKTPPGYSCYFSHPKYRFDLPFLTLDGIVDTDTHPIPVNFPFLINDNFEGKIEKGTPIVQIFPFKRSNWKSFYSDVDKKYDYEEDKYLTVESKYYKKNYWSRKIYK